MNEPMDKKSEPPIQIIIADDHPILSSGIQSALANYSEFVVLKEVSDSEQAIFCCQKYQPDILILDLNLSGYSSTNIVRQLGERCPEVKIVILATKESGPLVQQLIALGIAGYVLKDEDVDCLIRAIQTISQGGMWFSQAVDRNLRNWFAKSPDSMVDLLSCRELEVLQQIAKGYTNKRIAEELCISERTTRYHVEQIRRKLQVENRTEAVVKALQLGLIRVI